MISEGEDGRIGEQAWFGDSSVFGLLLTAFLFPGHFSSPSQMTATVFLCGADSSPGFRFDVHPLRHLWPLSDLVTPALSSPSFHSSSLKSAGHQTGRLAW